MQGCSKVDMIFAIDGSGSMAEEISALTSSSAFANIVSALELLNCGDIDYRIGVTNDATPSFITGPGWSGSTPWFDSINMSATEIQAAFSSAAPQVAPSGVSVGCEHVLTNTSQLLIGDTTGFLRPDALLVIVLITDVDDYGAYDQMGGNSCGIGCGTPGAPVADLYSNFLTLKGDDPAAVSAIVVAGDPTADGGVNFCGQPQSCGPPVSSFHATRLYDFASLQYEDNGVTANLCDGSANVPTHIEDALLNDIDLACQGFIPPG
jgi:hypothetical protein